MGTNHTQRLLLLAVLSIAMLGTESLFAYPGGVSGRTLKTTRGGCGSCHGSTANTGVVVTINGPQAVTQGQTYAFTVTVTGTSGSNGGVDIAAFRGSLAPVSSFLRATAGELVHSVRVAVPSTYQFNYTAPGTPGSDTLYATGKDNVMSSWNWAPNLLLTVNPAAPSAPVLAAPPDGSFDQPTSLTLSWNPSTGATSYRVQVSGDSLFGTTLLDDSTVTGTSRQAGPLGFSTKYYWRVRAKNAVGSSPYSARWSFTTVSAAPAVPTLVSPAPGSTGQPLTLNLRWNTSTRATSYRVQVSADSLFGTTVVDDSSLVDTTRQVNALFSLTRYYWRVRAKNAGGSSQFSAPWNFTTILQLPAQVLLVSPAHGATITVDSVRLVWRTGSPTPIRYWLERAGDSTFTSPTVDSTLVDTTALIRGLVGSRVYWWRVKARNASGWGPFSVGRSFATLLTAIGGSQLESQEFSLRQNYPNPFNPSTTIRFSVPVNASVSIVVFDVAGRMVMQAIERRTAAGTYDMRFDASGLSSGLYFYRMTARGDNGASFTQVRKMLLMK